MASAAEQMAANLSWGALGKATDLRQRIFFTLGLLIVYRIGTAALTAGKFDAFVSMDVQRNIARPSGFTVA